MSGGLYGRGKAPERECLKLAFWPAEDRRLWELAREPGNYFDDTRGARAGLVWSRETRPRLPTRPYESNANRSSLASITA